MNNEPMPIVNGLQTIRVDPARTVPAMLADGGGHMCPDCCRAHSEYVNATDATDAQWHIIGYAGDEVNGLEVNAPEPGALCAHCNRELSAIIDVPTAQILARMGEGHLQPFIEPGDCWDVDTGRGSFIVPADLVNRPEWIEPGTMYSAEDDEDDDYLSLCAALVQYAPEGIGPIGADDVNDVQYRAGGYLCRMSAPGYMDATEWEHYATAQECADALIESHGPDDEDDEPAADDEDDEERPDRPCDEGCPRRLVPSAECTCTRSIPRRGE